MDQITSDSQSGLFGPPRIDFNYKRVHVSEKKKIEGARDVNRGQCEQTM